jgi:hypothetical protein
VRNLFYMLTFHESLLAAPTEENHGNLKGQDGDSVHCYVRFEVFTAVTMKNGVFSLQRASVASCS